MSDGLNLQTHEWDDPDFDIDEAGYMLERPLNVPLCGNTRNDMRSETSFRILEEMTGVNPAPLSSMSYGQERTFWREFFEVGKTLSQDEHTQNFLRERPLNHADPVKLAIHKAVDAA